MRLDLDRKAPLAKFAEIDYRLPNLRDETSGASTSEARPCAGLLRVTRLVLGLRAAVTIPQVANLVVVFHDAVVLKLDDASYVYGELHVESFLVTRFRDILASLALLENGQIGTSCDRCFEVNPTSVYGSSDATPTLGVSPQTGHQLLQSGRSFCALSRTCDKDRFELTAPCVLR